MPKLGPDKQKLKKIRSILKRNPEGLWMREIARQVNLPKSTVHRYLTFYMEDEVEIALKGPITIVRSRK